MTRLWFVPCRSAGHLSTWAGKSSDPDKSFQELQAAKGAADEARFEVARRFTEVRARRRGLRAAKRRRRCRAACLQGRGGIQRCSKGSLPHGSAFACLVHACPPAHARPGAPSPVVPIPVPLRPPFSCFCMQMETNKRFEFLQSMVTAVDAHLRYFERGHQLFAGLEPYLQHALQARSRGAGWVPPAGGRVSSRFRPDLCACGAPGRLLARRLHVAQFYAACMRAGPLRLIPPPPPPPTPQLIEKLKADGEVQQARMEALISAHKSEATTRDAQVVEKAATSSEAPRPSGPLQVLTPWVLLLGVPGCTWWVGAGAQMRSAVRGRGVGMRGCSTPKWDWHGRAAARPLAPLLSLWRADDGGCFACRGGAGGLHPADAGEQGAAGHVAQAGESARRGQGRAVEAGTRQGGISRRVGRGGIDYLCTCCMAVA